MRAPKTKPQRKVLTVTLILLLCDQSGVLVVWRGFAIKPQRHLEQELQKLMELDCIVQTFQAFRYDVLTPALHKTFKFGGSTTLFSAPGKKSQTSITTLLK